VMELQIKGQKWQYSWRNWCQRQ